ncbi:MAG: hypothetical protein NTY77_01915 [Elusimicrobia bacterium]|nr:hypothetical protein [Elusimicrobiota bacterium]
MKTKDRKLPKFESVAEEAKYWETHSLAEHLREFKPTKVRFKRRSKLLSGQLVHLSAPKGQPSTGPDLNQKKHGRESKNSLTRPRDGELGSLIERR